MLYLFAPYFTGFNSVNWIIWRSRSVSEVTQRCRSVSGKTKVVRFNMQVGAVLLTMVDELYVTSMLALTSLSQIIGLHGVESANAI